MPMSYLKRRRDAFRYAFRGIATMFRSEPHASLHLIAAILVIAAGIYWRITPSQWCLCLLCIGAVFSAEAINTAIEALADRVSPEKHPLIEKAKDVAAAAVLIAAITAAIIGLIIFLPIWLN